MARLPTLVVRESDVADEDQDELVQELRNHVGNQIGPIAKPKSVMIVTELPKTRSGKIMRRLLKDVAENRDVGDTSTLTDSSVMELLADPEHGRQSSGSDRR